MSESENGGFEFGDRSRVMRRLIFDQRVGLGQPHPGGEHAGVEATHEVVRALQVIGIPAAAHIMNAIVLTAVLSALNSGLYASSRMLFALTRRGDAPRGLDQLSQGGVPVRAIRWSSPNTRLTRRSPT